MNEVEISEIDTCYEWFRLKDSRQEKVLLTSILEQGVREPLQCVIKADTSLVLLDGFKRLRCLKKLRLGVAPVTSLGADEPAAILQLLRLSNARTLNILEQAALVDELKKNWGMTVSAIALQLERSNSWVSVRMGILNEMTRTIKAAVFSGKFPIRSYMYTLRQFTRVNKINKSDIDAFVQSVSGRGLSIRDIEILAYGFFRGGPGLKEQIMNGSPEWTLVRMRSVESSLNDETLSELERRTIADLELFQKYMGRVGCEIRDPRLSSPSFFATAHLLAEGILGKAEPFLKTLEEFYAQKRETKRNESTA